MLPLLCWLLARRPMLGHPSLAQDWPTLMCTPLLLASSTRMAWVSWGRGKQTSPPSNAMMPGIVPEVPPPLSSSKARASPGGPNGPHYVGAPAAPCTYAGGLYPRHWWCYPPPLLFIFHTNAHPPSPATDAHLMPSGHFCHDLQPPPKISGRKWKLA